MPPAVRRDTKYHDVGNMARVCLLGPRRARLLPLLAWSALLLPSALQAGTVDVIPRADPSLLSDTPSGSFTPSSPSVSSDGRFVAFVNGATNLVAGQTDTTGTADVFLYDRVAGTTTLVSRNSGLPPGTHCHGLPSRAPPPTACIEVHWRIFPTS